VLVSTPSLLGHVHPMAPLARALVARGHDLLWAIPADGVAHVERLGVRAVAAGRPTDVADLFRRYPEIAALPPPERPEAMFGKMFGAVAAPATLADLLPVALEWRPQLVLCDAAELAGHVVAAELGVPSVTKGFGPLLPEGRLISAAMEVAPLWRSRGLEPRPYGGSYEHLYLDVYPPALEAPDASHIGRRQLMRPVSDDARPGSSTPRPIADRPPDGSLVYVTMGTVFNGTGPLHTVLTALRDFPGQILVTVGPEADPAVVGEQPAHVHVERYVPQSVILPRCDVVVSHAGSGTVLGTLAVGRPQLCLPQGADQFLNAAAVVSAGAGLALDPREATVEAIREAVGRLVEDVAFAHAARRVGASIAAMPSPDDVAAVLDALPEPTRHRRGAVRSRPR
jgi:UDP:flavonoid glycosyltransferase YjiC (YdhE family)